MTTIVWVESKVCSVQMFVKLQAESKLFPNFVEIKPLMQIG